MKPICTVMVVLLAGCKSDVESNTGKPLRNPYNIECINGVEYLTKAMGSRGYMTPHINSETLDFVRCEEDF